MFIGYVVDRPSKRESSSCECERDESEYQWYERISEDHVAKALVVCFPSFLEWLVSVRPICALGRTSSTPRPVLVRHRLLELALSDDLGGRALMWVRAAGGEGVPSGTDWIVRLLWGGDKVVFFAVSDPCYTL